MENIILSLLLIKSMTTYEMKMFIHHTLSTVCSDSLGSIQAALKKLQQKNYVEVCERIENKVLKREFSITKEGREEFKKWICVPMDIHKAKNMEEGKFFFLGMAPKEVRIKSIEGYIDSLKVEQQKLGELRNIVESTRETVIQQNVERIRKEPHLSEDLLEVSGEETLERVARNIADYQIYNLSYGERRVREDIEFFEMVLEKETEGLQHT